MDFHFAPPSSFFSNFQFRLRQFGHISGFTTRGDHSWPQRSHFTLYNSNIGFSFFIRASFSMYDYHNTRLLISCQAKSFILLFYFRWLFSFGSCGVGLISSSSSLIRLPCETTSSCNLKISFFKVSSVIMPHLPKGILPPRQIAYPLFFEQGLLPTRLPHTKNTYTDYF